MRYSNITTNGGGRYSNEDVPDSKLPDWVHGNPDISEIPGDTFENVARNIAQNQWLIVQAILGGAEFLVDSLAWKFSPTTDPLLIPIDSRDARAESIVGSMKSISAGRSYLVLWTVPENGLRTMAGVTLSNYPAEILRTSLRGRMVTFIESTVTTMAGVIA